MALLTEIKRMQNEGRTEQEIINSLKQQGVSPREIVEALGQSKIKEAVGEPEQYASPAPQEVPQESSMPVPGTDVMPMPSEEIQPTPAMAQEFAPQQTAQMEQSTQYQYPQAQQAQQQYPEYQQYPQQQGGISPDTITEISEQVVSEKLSPLRKDIEKVLDLKTTVDSKLEYMDERLKRIEKIIDRLNLSIMQKVGDYMSNIDDIKKELIETQKSFKSLVPALDGKSEKPKVKPLKETPAE